MNEKYNAYVRSVADYFIEEMKKGTAPWQQDWDNAANVVPVVPLPMLPPGYQCAAADDCQNKPRVRRQSVAHVSSGTGARRESKKGRTRHQVHLLEALSGKGRKR